MRPKDIRKSLKTISKSQASKWFDLAQWRVSARFQFWQAIEICFLIATDKPVRVCHNDFVKEGDFLSCVKVAEINPIAISRLVKTSYF